MTSKAPFIGIKRHRIACDGDGIVSLAGFHSCPLNCRYCLNPHALAAGTSTENLTPRELFERLKIDNLYFLATNGGVTFGGGEPSLRPDFICEFRKICGNEWKINLETSLNVPRGNIEKLVPVVDFWIVDIKDMNAEIYEKYTGKSNVPVKENLKILLENHCPLKIRVPAIPDFNTETDIAKSVAELLELGVPASAIEKFTYIKPQILKKIWQTQIPQNKVLAKS